MKKLYIPTSTLNFNNILSSESISPKAFYAKRGFGYSRWTPIPENECENAITLYNKPFCFNRPISDIEDHSMLIEILTDEKLESVADGVYYCGHTIYLSPWHTRFIFFSEQDKKVTLSLSDSSLETKMLRLYNKRLTVEQYPNQEWPNVKKEVSLNEEGIKQDKRVNKMKGLLYGYYIGALLSVNPDIVHKYNVLQELQNIFSAIISSDDHQPTATQEARISFLLFDWQKTNPSVAYLATQLAEPQKINEVLNNLLSLGVSFPNMISTDEAIDALTHPKGNDNQALEKLNWEWDNLRYKSKLERKLLHPDKEEIITNDGCLVKIAEDVLSHEKEQELVKTWINEILFSDKYNGKVSSFKGALADDVTLKAKDIYGEQWNDSEAKIALNNMRRYVYGNASDFRWDNPIYSSIAAVIAKGDDWEQLLAFMKSKRICDYRLAFAFYGELNGFANLTRDFTDLLLNEDSKYVADVYKEFAGQLFGVDVTDDSSSQTVPNTHEELAPDKMVQPKINEPMPTWKEKTVVFINKEIAKKKQKTVLNLLADATINTIDKFLNRLSSLDGWKTSKDSKKIREFLRPQNSIFRDSSTELLSASNSIVKRNKEKTSMLKDGSWWNYTASMIPDSKARKQYLSDVKWFIENHNEYYDDKKKGCVNGRYYGHPTENTRLLERFRVYLQNKEKPNSQAPWIAKEYTKVPIGRIIEYLQNMYGNR